MFYCIFDALVVDLRMPLDKIISFKLSKLDNIKRNFVRNMLYASLNLFQFLKH